MREYGPMEGDPLKLRYVTKPRPSRGHVIVKVSARGACHTDLHVMEKELEPRALPIIPGHQVVGIVEEIGSGVKNLKSGDRVGVTWVNSNCGTCEFCASERENLCKSMRFTGYDINGGFAEYVTVSQDFAFKVPEKFDDVHAAPLFCAGIIGYRALRLSGITRGSTLAIFGFGASGHIMAQIAKHWDCRFIAFTRGSEHKHLAESLGADWVGDVSDEPPFRADAAVITAPAGELVIEALKKTKKGCRIAIEDIYMSQILAIDYNKYLYHERWLGSVTNYTRDDAKEFLRPAAEMPIVTHVEKFPLEIANDALNLMKRGRI